MVHVYCHLKVRYSFRSRYCNAAFSLSVASISLVALTMLLLVADRTDCPFFLHSNPPPTPR